MIGGSEYMRRPALNTFVCLTVSLAIPILAGGSTASARSSSAGSDETKIAFVRIDRGGGTAIDGEPIGEIYLMRGDGTGLRRLTHNTEFIDEDPAWSPNGRTLAFTSNRAGTLDIWTMDTDGGNLHRVSRRSTGNPYNDVLYDLEPAWSPDGTKFVFVGHRFYHGGFGTNAILVMNVDGSHVRRLALGRQPGYAPTWKYSPTWSPDGRRIAFSRFHGTLPDNPKTGVAKGDFDIWTMSADGSHQHHVRDTCCYAAWSPDGSRIAYMRGGDLWVMSPSGNAKRQVTKGPAYDVDPTWSPDGMKLAFASNRSGNFDIWVVNADGSGLHRLTTDPADEGSPAWSPVPQ
jgi:TolB protein